MKKLISILSVSSLFVLSLQVGASSAQAETLKCKLYINDATAVTSTVTPPSAGVALNTLRSGGVCVFTDGRVAEKQFVMISQAIGDGSTRYRPRLQRLCLRERQFAYAVI